MGKTSVGGAVTQLTLFCFSSENMHCFVMVLFRYVFLCFAKDLSWLFTLLSNAISYACNFTVSVSGVVNSVLTSPFGLSRSWSLHN